MEALENLGIDWKLFVAQAVNFLALLFLLRRYAYRPMLEFLEKRKARIAQGLQDAQSAARKLASLETEEKATLARARGEAKRMLADALIAVKKRELERLAETETETKRLFAEAVIQIEREKTRSLSEAKGELASLVTAAVEKMLQEKLDAETDRRLIEQMVK